MYNITVFFIHDSVYNKKKNMFWGKQKFADGIEDFWSNSHCRLSFHLNIP